MIVAIHQTNFMPWLPFFKKMEQADAFVFLRHCQWSKGGYQNRFDMNGNWYTMSVQQGLEDIADKMYLDPMADWGRIISRLPEHKGTLLTLRSALHHDKRLCGVNFRLALQIRNMLGIRTVLAADRPTEATGTKRLVNICKEAKATTYLSGPSGRNYLDLELFDRAGIGVEFFEADEADKVPILEAI